jgi:hypothetical protein
VGYPLVEVQGSYREIGRGIGSAMGRTIRDYLESSRDYPRCVAFARERGPELERLLLSTRRRFPHLVEELQGMADGLGVPFLELFAYNCRSETALLERGDGCSTLVLRSGDRMILAHNEDGDDRNVGRMFLAKVRAPSGITFLAYVYPGLLPGNGPGLNDRGIVQTTNYIQPRVLAPGVPRYFVGRAVLESKTLEAAVALATEDGRAFPWHHNLASLQEARYLSVEALPETYDVLEPRGVYIHTNHIIHPKLLEDPDEPPDVPGESSRTRMRVLSAAIEEGGAPDDADGLQKLLTLHEGRPYSPCRHPQGSVHGVTLGMAIFEAPALAMTLYHGNPCRGVSKRYEV